MINQLHKTEKFALWMDNLRDIRARARIQVRLDRLARGNAGDHKSVGGGVVELRIDYGAGYRVYYTFRGQTIIFLLIGGDKSTQQTDIDMAQQLAKQLEN